MILSADAHIQEPEDLFLSQLSPADHYRAPVYHRLPGNMKLWSANGILIAKSPEYVRRPAGLPPNGGSAKPWDHRQWPNIAADDVSGYLADLDADGVWGSVLHPGVGITVYDMEDLDFAMECTQICNNHVAETYIGERLYPQALIPLGDIDAAVAEIERVAALGFRGLELPMTAPPEGPYFTRRYDPVWAAAERLGLPIFMHIGSGNRRGSANPGLSLGATAFLNVSGTNAWPADHPDHLAANLNTRTATGGFGGYGGQVLTSLPQLISGGVFERFPNLHIVFVEVGARWLLNVMDTMDEAWHTTPGTKEINRTFFRTDGAPVHQFEPDEFGLEWPYPLAPSEYVRRQVHLTFMDDWVALRNRTLTGIEPLLWGNDYPHYEGTWPDSQAAITTQSERAGLSADEHAAIFGGTIGRLLGLDVLDSAEPAGSLDRAAVS